MPRIFTITAATESISLDRGGRGEITFTAANSSGRPQRAIARLIPLGSTKDEWLSLGGEVERDFPIDGVHQFVAKVAPPPGTPAGRYTFRLDVVSVRNPDEDFAEGPTVGFEVKPVVENGRHFPWWIVAAAAGVVVLGVLGLLLLRGRKNDVEGPSLPTVAVSPVDLSPTASSTDTPPLPAGDCVVPDIRPLSPEAARHALDASRLRLGRFEQGGDRRGQNPEPGARVPCGSRVDVFAIID
jgi:hypothetical protein